MLSMKIEIEASTKDEILGMSCGSIPFAIEALAFMNNRKAFMNNFSYPRKAFLNFISSCFFFHGLTINAILLVYFFFDHERFIMLK